MRDLLGGKGANFADLNGHRYGASADTALCLGALHDAVRECFPDRLDDLKALAPQLSHDWGSQFTSRRYGGELRTLGVTSRPTMIGSPEPNGIMERFFGSLEDEEVRTTKYDPRADTVEAIDA
jgi:transposase InsO family protein